MGMIAVAWMVWPQNNQFTLPRHHKRSRFQTHWISLVNHTTKYKEDRVALSYNYWNEYKSRLLTYWNGSFDWGYVIFYARTIQFDSHSSITIIENFLTEEQCNNIIKIAEENSTWVPSTWSIHPDSAKNTYKRKSVQTKETHIPFITANINRLFGALLNFECSGVIKYEYGDFIHPHSDSNGDDASLLIYLNSVSYGGETCFNDFDYCISPKQGTAVWWMSTEDHPMIHSSFMPSTLTKFVINCIEF